MTNKSVLPTLPNTMMSDPYEVVVDTIFGDSGPGKLLKSDAGRAMVGMMLTGKSLEEMKDTEVPTEERLKNVFSDEDVVDVTDEVMEYERGKVFECECGQGFGVDFDVRMVRCPKCGSVVVDTEWEDRSPPDRDRGQSSLSEWGR